MDREVNTDQRCNPMAMPSQTSIGDVWRSFSCFLSTFEVLSKTPWPTLDVEALKKTELRQRLAEWCEGQEGLAAASSWGRSRCLIQRRGDSMAAKSCCRSVTGLCTARSNTQQLYWAFCSLAELLWSEWLKLFPFSGKLLWKPDYEVYCKCYFPGGQQQGGVGMPVLASAAARAVRCHQQWGTRLCSCPARGTLISTERAIPEGKKWANRKRYLPNVTALFLVVEHPHSSSGAFS